MSTVTIDATHPTAAININVLKSLLDKVLEANRKGGPLPHLAPDEYILLNELRFAVTTGEPSTNTVTSITITY